MQDSLPFSRDLYCSQPDLLVLSQRSLDKSLPFHKVILSLLLNNLASLDEDANCGLSCMPPRMSGEPEILRSVLREFRSVREFAPSLKNIITEILEFRDTHLLLFAGEEKRGCPKALKDWELRQDWLLNDPRLAGFKALLSKVVVSDEWDQIAQTTLLTRQSLEKIKPFTNHYNITKDLFSGFDPNKQIKETWFGFAKDQAEAGGGFSAHLISEKPFTGSVGFALTALTVINETTFSETAIVENICSAIGRLIAMLPGPIHLRLASPSAAFGALLLEEIYRKFYVSKRIRSLDQAVMNRIITPCLSFLALLDRRVGNSLYISLENFPDVQMVLLEQKHE